MKPDPCAIDFRLAGTVFDIKRFATGDGPGIRGLVFLKGCPMACAWCSNPESQAPRPEIMYLRTKCVGCGKCVKACSEHAVVLNADGGVRMLPNRCVGCGRCVDVCLHDARELIGRTTTVGDILNVLRRDRRFYDHSGGGMTLGGGEPLMQCEFSRELLRASKAEGMHTAIETSGQVPWDCLASVLPYLDLIFFDVKHMDDAAWVEGTGCTGERPLENLRRVADGSFGGQVIVRVPFIPGFNDSDEIQERIYRHVAGLRGVLRVEVLPYHRFGRAKYVGLGREYRLEHLEPVMEQDLVRLSQLGAACGIEVQIDSK